MSAFLTPAQRGTLALYLWCKPHVDSCHECAMKWWLVLELELGAVELAEVDLKIPASQGSRETA